MFLTAVMSKMGVYGFFRILWPLFPEQLRTAAPVLLTLALAGVLLGAFAAIAQKDIKRMIAYSSINHVSYCLLALFAVAGQAAANAAASVPALNGAILQMANHGLSAGALFLAAGILEARAGGLRGLGDFGGVRAKAPVFAGFCGIALFSSLGLPGLNGFPGEFLIFLGVFGLKPWFAAAAMLALFATAWFLLTFFQKVFCGPVGQAAAIQGFRDLTLVEKLNFIPLLFLMFLAGVFPGLVTHLFNPLVADWVAQLE
jgi:NADH-quinone oxidoreductase subunit M